ncbi:MAG: hypothetical protein DHS20C18_02270 [Saprospiraceae bacterium]|nr:MAG: hypothetical protein DHS20C18_02270 [Saprospiraceae bacterium]
MKEKLNTYFDQRKDYGAIFIRLLIGFHLIYGVQDNVLSWERMIEFKDFLVSHQFPFPFVCAVVSVYMQLICGLLYIFGAFIRMAALVMITNFLIAILMVHLGDNYPNAFPALAMLFGSLFLLFNGAGKFSIDLSFKNTT